MIFLGRGRGGSGDQSLTPASTPNPVPRSPTTWLALPHRGVYGAPPLLHRHTSVRPSTPTPPPHRLSSAPSEALSKPQLLGHKTPAAASASSKAEAASDVHLAPPPVSSSPAPASFFPGRGDKRSPAPPPAPTPRRFKPVSPTTRMVHRATMALPHRVLDRPSVSLLRPSASSAASSSATPFDVPSAPVLSTPPSAAGLENVPETALAPQGVAGAAALGLAPVSISEPGPSRPARPVLRTIGSTAMNCTKSFIDDLAKKHLYSYDDDVIHGGTIDNWACLNFSSMCAEDVQRFGMDLIHMCNNAAGMTFSPDPCLEAKSVAPKHLENALRDVHWRAKQMLGQGQQGKGSQLQLLIVVLPEIGGFYEKVKRVCENEIGIMCHCCLPKHASRPSKEYLESVALEMSFKFGGHKAVLQRALVRNGIHVSEAPTTILGADIVHPLPVEDTAPPIAYVKVCFCEHEVQMPINQGTTTVLELVLLALKKLNIRARDFYLTLRGRILDGGLMVNSVPALGGSSIHVNPRMRGGSQLFRKVYIRKSMRQQGSNCFATLLTDFSQYLLHHLLVCICREGHMRGISWNGAFNISHVLLFDGHMRINPQVPVHKYSPKGGAADYRRLYDIVLMFGDPVSMNYPMHVSHLLNTLLNADESVRRKPAFVAFLINHPCLLTYAEKQKLYSLVDRLLLKLDPAVLNDVNQQLAVRGWETTIQKAAAFDHTYKYVPCQRNPSVPGAAVQNPKFVPYQKNPSIPGAAVQNPKNASVPGAAAQNPPVPGAAVQNTNIAAKPQGYGPQTTQCLHLGRNFLNHPPYGASMEEAEVALSFLVGFVLPEVLEVLSKVLKHKDARMFMEIISIPMAEKSTVRVII